jgi:hypothetical protein
MLVTKRPILVDTDLPQGFAPYHRAIQPRPRFCPQALLSEFLALRQPPEVQTAAIETLARFEPENFLTFLRVFRL